jgi:two-component system, cell cycle sensor histidine kinase and response regulator CckA
MQTVLAVDDDPIVLNLARMILERADYGCIAIEAPEDALAALEDQSLSIDLLLADIVMPAMNGVVLAKRAVAIRPTIKVLLMTAYSYDALREMNLMPNGTHVIMKPFKPQLLISRLAEIMD